MKKVVLILRPVNRLQLSDRGRFKCLHDFFYSWKKLEVSVRGTGYANIRMCLGVPELSKIIPWSLDEGRKILEKICLNNTGELKTSLAHLSIDDSVRKVPKSFLFSSEFKFTEKHLQEYVHLCLLLNLFRTCSSKDLSCFTFLIVPIRPNVPKRFNVAELFINAGFL